MKDKNLRDFFQEDMNTQKTNNIDDTANIESGHAKAVRER
jgi:hypothetical protein